MPARAWERHSQSIEKGGQNSWEAPDYFEDEDRTKDRAAPRTRQQPSGGDDPVHSRLDLLEVVQAVLNNPNLRPEDFGLTQRIGFAKVKLRAKSQETIDQELARQGGGARGWWAKLQKETGGKNSRAGEGGLRCPQAEQGRGRARAGAG